MIDSVGLLWSTAKLIGTLRRDFSNSLTEESASLKRLFVIFTISYFFRAFLLLPQGRWYTWLDDAFGNDEEEAYFAITIVYFNSFYLWDIVPLALNFYMHHQNFKTGDQGAESEDFDVIKTV